ncbi:MAG: MTAP family purine nucleoside phosphorylase [Armatimonadetes bacterium]|nr:MTAP family purine nucleoside phosphorylase [Armatimonadota bacterium]
MHRLGGAAVLEPIRTPFGLSATIRLALVGDLEVMVISRHGESGYEVSAPFVNYRANIWALKELGVERIVSWSGPGAIDPGLAIGEILVPVDIVDETRGRPSTFFEGRGIGFIRQNPVFCPDLAERLRRAIETRQGQCRTGDVYVCTQGPRLETAAEIRKFATFGATLVGMTLAPEAFLARELEICYCPICYVTNYAEGVVDRPYQSGELFEGMLTQEEKSKADAAIEILPEIILDALRTVPDQRTCPCARSMERYRRRGDIGDDWRSWISK